MLGFAFVVAARQFPDILYMLRDRLRQSPDVLVWGPVGLSCSLLLRLQKLLLLLLPEVRLVVLGRAAVRLGDSPLAVKLFCRVHAVDSLDFFYLHILTS